MGWETSVGWPTSRPPGTSGRPTGSGPHITEAGRYRSKPQKTARLSLSSAPDTLTQRAELILPQLSARDQYSSQSSRFSSSCYHLPGGTVVCPSIPAGPTLLPMSPAQHATNCSVGHQVLFSASERSTSPLHRRGRRAWVGRACAHLVLHTVHVLRSPPGWSRSRLEPEITAVIGADPDVQGDAERAGIAASRAGCEVQSSYVFVRAGLVASQRKSFRSQRKRQT